MNFTDENQTDNHTISAKIDGDPCELGVKILGDGNNSGSNFI